MAPPGHCRRHTNCSFLQLKQSGLDFKLHRNCQLPTANPKLETRNWELKHKNKKSKSKGKAAACGIRHDKKQQQTTAPADGTLHIAHCTSRIAHCTCQIQIQIPDLITREIEIEITQVVVPLPLTSACGGILVVISPKSYLQSHCGL